jgi:ankyrin repeat protein
MTTKSFKELCEQLELTPHYEQESQLRALESWSYQNISQDVRFEGDELQQYNQYLAFVSNYLDNFIPHVSGDLAKKIPQIENLNIIQYAVNQGYDRFITDLTTIPQDLLNEGDLYDMTPLHKSAVAGHVFTVRALLKKGANVRKINRQQQYPLFSALFVPILHDANWIKSKEVIFKDLLPCAPELLFEPDIAGDTVIHQMAAQGFDELIKEILSTHPKLAFIKNNASVYPVHTAILNQKFGPLKTLLAIPGVSTLVDSKKRIPLHYAARYGNALVIEQCCLATKDLNMLDQNHKTPLLLAIEADNKEAIEILQKHGAQ